MNTIRITQLVQKLLLFTIWVTQLVQQLHPNSAITRVNWGNWVSRYPALDGSTSGGLDTGTIVGIVVSVVIAGIGMIFMIVKGQKDAENMDMLRNAIGDSNTIKQNPAYSDWSSIRVY